MSTRATYLFNRDGVKTCFYIHHDGYPEGAAVYFYNMLKCDSAGGFKERFMRANLRAEITKSHAAHGDTEFHYTFNENTNQLLVMLVGFDSDKGETVFSGDLADFINSNHNMIEGYETIVDGKPLGAHFEALAKQISDTQRFIDNGGTGNGSSCQHRVAALYMALRKHRDLFTSEQQEEFEAIPYWLIETSNQFMPAYKHCDMDKWLKIGHEDISLKLLLNDMKE